jgi:hypothetical protein
VGNLLINADRFITYSQSDPAGTDCILWTGAKHKQGYGMMGYIDTTNNRKTMNVVHRLVKMVEIGRELTRDEFVVHSCSNPLCINHEHLILGDVYTRNNVMQANGRASKTQGKNKVRGVLVKQNRQYKYTDDEIRWIREANTKEIAEKYNMSRDRAGHFRWGMRKGFKWLK